MSLGFYLKFCLYRIQVIQGSCDNKNCKWLISLENKIFENQDQHSVWTLELIWESWSTECLNSWIQKHVLLRHQSYLIVFMGNKNLRFWEIMPLSGIHTFTNTGLSLWCLTPLSTIFQLYRGNQFYWWWKLEYPICRKSLTNSIT